jgi:hypothetical protein
MAKTAKPITPASPIAAEAAVAEGPASFHVHGAVDDVTIDRVRSALAANSARLVEQMSAPKPLERPSLCRAVIVRTASPIAGTREHAAIVTKVVGADAINAFLMPGEGMPYPLYDVPHVSHVAEGALGWRWPTRT